jgi:threonine dehydrogenase-like Zn-dependent dehydrogenase
MEGNSVGAAKNAKAATMRAAVVVEPQRAQFKEVRIPEPGPSEVRVRIEGCGVCASNLPAWEGRQWFSYPLPAGAMGHEGWGRIDALGQEVKGFNVGDRVAALSYHAYAEYDIASADALAPLPAALDGKPFPGEALGCAMNVFRRSRVRPGQNVAIVGVGFMGAVLTSLASRAGARVIAISRRTFALDIAREFGASETVPMDDHGRIIERVKALTAGRGCQRVIEATGHQWPLDLAAELTCERGRLVIAGYHQDGLRQINAQLWNWRGLDVINAHERDPKAYLAGMRAAIDAVVTGKLDPSPLYTHTFNLDRLGDALDAVSRRPEGFLKAVIKI